MLKAAGRQVRPQLASVGFALVNTGKAWFVYIVLRVLFFAVPFTAFMLIGWPWWLSMAVATLIALALSVIFLSKQRDTASAGIYEWRLRDRTADDIDEDAALDSVSPTNAPAPASTVGTETLHTDDTADANAADVKAADTNSADVPADIPVESKEERQ